MHELPREGFAKDAGATYVSMIAEDLHASNDASRKSQTLRDVASERRETRPANSGHTQSEEDRTVKLELSLPPEIAAQLSAGAQIVFHQENGHTKVEILSFGKKDKLERQRVKAQHQIADKAPQAPARPSKISDDDMIDSLIQCAKGHDGDAAAQENVGSTSKASRSSDPMPISDLDDALVQALAADACSETKPHARSSACSDADLVAALAGCVNSSEKEADAHPCSRSNSPFTCMVEWFDNVHEDIGHLHHSYLDDDGILEPLM